MLELQSQLTLEGNQPLFGMRYASRCWVDNWATQKALVGDANQRPARQRVLAVPQRHVCNPQ